MSGAATSISSSCSIMCAVKERAPNRCSGLNSEPAMTSQPIANSAPRRASIARPMREEGHMRR
jgi:hypothetical protein